MRAWRGVFIVGIAASSIESYAAEYCVASTADLEEAIQAANSSQESHRVMLVAGEYAIDWIGFGTPGALSIEGGYEAGCLQRSFGATTTVIHPASETAFEVSFHAFGGDLAISDITLLNYAQVFIFPQGVDHSLHVARTAIVLQSEQANVEMHTDSSPMLLENVLIDSETSACALLTSSSDLDFVTVTNRGGGKGICVFGDLTVRNSIVYAVNDFDIQSQSLLAVSTIFDDFDGALDPGSTGNLVGPVVFEVSSDTIVRNRPANIPNQIARDSGIPIAGNNFDLLGNPRLIGSGTDRGAFELTPHCDLILKNGFDNTGICPPAGPRGHSLHARPACRYSSANC